ncbi:LysR substrate-binding domain-containing protein [Cupriavidus sp. 2TAF22]|uniref:LysR substrate-binding domain-containing protein n=1 Tax=unclassified Cupriavidus TaxID=2640874 RepID=UPI003F90B95D
MKEAPFTRSFLTDLVRDERRKLQIRIQIRSFEAMCRMIEAGVGIDILPLSAALRHRRTMKLEILELNEPWVIRERVVIARDLDGLPGCAKALIDELIKVAEAAGGSPSGSVT